MISNDRGTHVENFPIEEMTDDQKALLGGLVGASRRLGEPESPTNPERLCFLTTVIRRTAQDVDTINFDLMSGHPGVRTGHLVDALFTLAGTAFHALQCLVEKTESVTIEEARARHKAWLKEEGKSTLGSGIESFLTEILGTGHQGGHMIEAAGKAARMVSATWVALACCILEGTEERQRVCLNPGFWPLAEGMRERYMELRAGPEGQAPQGALAQTVTEKLGLQVGEAALCSSGTFQLRALGFDADFMASKVTGTRLHEAFNVARAVLNLARFDFTAEVPELLEPMIEHYQANVVEQRSKAVAYPEVSAMTEVIAAKFSEDWIDMQPEQAAWLARLAATDAYFATRMDEANAKTGAE